MPAGSTTIISGVRWEKLALAHMNGLSRESLPPRMHVQNTWANLINFSI